MKTLLKKLKSRAGESLVETLVAVLIIALAAGLLAGGATTTVKLNQRAAESGRVFFEELSQAEAGETYGTGTAQVRLGSNFYQLDITFTGDEDGLRAYRVEGAP